MSDYTPSHKKIGKITKLNKQKGWGFIESKEVPFTRIYFYWRNLATDTVEFKDLNENDEVEFDLIEPINPKTGLKQSVAIRIYALEPENGIDNRVRKGKK